MTLPMTLIKLHSLNGQKGERMTHTPLHPLFNEPT